jgi:hypothetical protein
MRHQFAISYVLKAKKKKVGCHTVLKTCMCPTVFYLHRRTRDSNFPSGYMLNLITKSSAPLSLKVHPILQTYKSVWI